MSPELEHSLKERIAARVGYEEIEMELLAAGYSKEIIALAYAKAKQSANPARTGVLSSGTSLFKDGFSVAKKRLDLIILLGLSSAILTLVSFEGEAIQDLAMAGLLGTVGLIALVVYVLGLMAMYFIIVKSSTERVSLKDGLTWAVANIFTLTWLGLLSFFIIWGGLTMFIVPGIIIGILIFFSYYSYIHDGERGMGAVLRSREVVAGRKLRVLKRLLILFGYSILISIAIAIPYSLAEAFDLDARWLLVVIEVVVQSLTALLTITTTAAGNFLYVELAQDRPATIRPKAVTLKYAIVGFVGFFSFIGLIVLLVFAYFWGTALEPLQATQNSDAVRAQVVFTEPIAEGYFTERGTFEGVCDALVPAVAIAENVECFSTESAWALAAQTGDEYWCTDIAGYGKLIPSPLNGRTNCLNLPSATEPEEMMIEESEATSTTPEGEDVLPMM